MDLPLPLRVQGRVSRLGEMGDTPERGAPLGLVGAVRAKVGQYLRYLVSVRVRVRFRFRLRVRVRVRVRVGVS